MSSNVVYAIVKAGGRQEKVSVGDIVVVDRVSAVDPTAVRRTAVVLVGRRGWRGGRNGADAWPDAVPVLHLPYDPALHRPGPVPGADALGRAGREGVAAWQELVARLLG